jgi:hypothetical protein
MPEIAGAAGVAAAASAPGAGSTDTDGGVGTDDIGCGSVGFSCGSTDFCNSGDGDAVLGVNTTGILVVGRGGASLVGTSGWECF